MVKKSQLLLHERTVDLVLSADFGQHVLELRGAMVSDLRRVLIHEVCEHRDVHLIGIDPELDAGAAHQLVALELHHLAAMHLCLKHSGQPHDVRNRALADRRRLLEHNREHASCGR